MKKVLLLGLLALAALITQSFIPSADKAKEEGYEIKLHINGIHDTIFFLGNHFGEKQYIQDTQRVDSKGWVTFKGKEKLEGGIYLGITAAKKYFEIIVTNNQHFTLETDTADFVKNMKVKNSPDNEVFYQYLNYISGKQSEIDPWRKILQNKQASKDSTELARKRLTEIDNEVKKYKENIIKTQPDKFISTVFLASQEPDVPEAPVVNGVKDSTFQYRYFKAHFFDKVDFSNPWLLRTPVFESKIKFYLEKLTYQIPDSLCQSCFYICDKAKANKDMYKYCVVYCTSEYESSKIMGMDAVFNCMVEKYYITNQTPWVDSVTMYKITDKAKKLKPLLIGKVAPNLIMKDTSDIFQNMYNIKARFTILCFWDPDCSHCKKEVPVLYEEYQKLKNKDVKVMAICTETERKKWTDFIIKNKLDWYNVADIELHNNFRSIYDITSTPVVYCLDRNKKILAKRLPVEKLSEFIEHQIKIEDKKAASGK